MKEFLKKIRNPYFSLGVDVMLLISVIGNFLDGDFSTKFTAVVGVIAILLIGLNLMEIERIKQEEKE